MAPLGASSSTEMGTEIEKGAIQFCGPIRDCLAWHSQIWGPTEKELRETGFLWDKFLSEQPVVVGDDGELVGLRRAVQDSLPPILAARCDHLKWIEINQTLAELRERLKVAIRSFTDSHAIASLREAVDSLDSRAYRRGYTRLLELHELRRNLQRRNILLAQLEPPAPACAPNSGAQRLARGGLQLAPAGYCDVAGCVGARAVPAAVCSLGGRPGIQRVYCLAETRDGMGICERPNCDLETLTQLSKGSG